MPGRMISEGPLSQSKLTAGSPAARASRRALGKPS